MGQCASIIGTLLHSSRPAVCLGSIAYRGPMVKSAIAFMPGTPINSFCFKVLAIVSSSLLIHASVHCTPGWTRTLQLTLMHNDHARCTGKKAKKREGGATKYKVQGIYYNPTSSTCTNRTRVAAIARVGHWHRSRKWGQPLSMSYAAKDPYRPTDNAILISYMY